MSHCPSLLPCSGITPALPNITSPYKREKRAVFGCALKVTIALGCHPIVQHGLWNIQQAGCPDHSLITKSGS